MPPKLLYHFLISAGQGRKSKMANRRDKAVYKSRSERSCMHTSKGKKPKIFYLLLHIIRKCLVTSPEAGLQHASWLLQKANVGNNKCLHFLLFIAFINELASYGMEYSFSKFRSSVLGVSYPKIFLTSAHR